MGLIDRLARAIGYSRDNLSPNAILTVDQVAELMQFSFNGNAYVTSGINQTLQGHAEEADGSFAGMVQQAYKTNGVVFACMLARMQLFTEARFQYQELRNGRPGKLFGDQSLGILEHPYPTAVTGDLLARAIQDADIGGTWFGTRRRNGIRRLRPDWVTMVLGSENDPEVEAGDIDADVLGIIYHPGGRNSGRDPVALLRSEIAIFAPIPDPIASFRGMSWLTPIMREVIADKQMTDHKSQFLVNGATPNLTVAIDKDLKEAASPQAFAEWVEAFKKTNADGGNYWERYKTWYLAGGTTVTKVGSNMQEIDFKSVQGAGETRIAAAAGVPPVIVGLSEGLQAATYSNYGQARRRFADNTMRPLWRNFAGSLETIVPPPAGSRLWYDDRDIQALAEDKKDLAEVAQLHAQTIRTYLDSGFTSASAVEAVVTGDQSRLVHTGLFSVQLQAPGSTKMPQGEAPGETPVGPGTGPEVPKINPASTKALPAGRSLAADLAPVLADRP